jgi:hypothetical protein
MTTISKPLKEAVWRKDYGDQMEVKCWVCNQNKISPFNFECGHIKSRKRGGSIELNNLKAICGVCNKSMGTKDMLHFRTHLWKGRKMPKKKQGEEIKNINFNLMSTNIPKVVKIAPPEIIKIDNSTDIIKVYSEFKRFIQPRARMSDVSMWYENYICCLDSIIENPELSKSMNIYQCLEKFSQTKTWYDTASGYERGKYNDLLFKFRSLIN